MKILEYLYSHKDEFLKDLFDLVKIPSVRSNPGKDMPYGENCAKVLERMMEIAEREGLKTQNFDNYAATATYGEEVVKLAILTHLDVVPEGEGWIFDPYFMTIENGKAYGRGTSDDKGAALMSLWAIKALKELKIPLAYSIKLIFGAGEETGCSDMEYYMQKEKMPPYVFSPDASFPVINTEKGQFCKEFTSQSEKSTSGIRFDNIDGGTIANAVPEKCTVKIKGFSEYEIEKFINKAQRKTDVKFVYEYKSPYIIITAEGKSTHSSTPQFGNNAITAMLYLLCKMPFTGDAFDKVKNLYKMFPHGEFFGESLGTCVQDDITGNSTFSLDILKFDGSTFYGVFDARVSLNATPENTSNIIFEKFSACGMNIKDTIMTPPHHVDPNSEIVRILNSAYEKYSGEESYCSSMGGFSYVHNIENAVAFGPKMPGMDTNIHGANEFLKIDDALKATAIFAEAIINICS